MKPIQIKTMTFSEMISEHMKKVEEAQKYVKETGLCSNCKKNPVVEDDLRCQECIDETNNILRELGVPHEAA